MSRTVAIIRAERRSEIASLPHTKESLDLDVRLLLDALDAAEARAEAAELERASACSRGNAWMTRACDAERDLERKRDDRFFVSGELLELIERVERRPVDFDSGTRCLAAGLRRALEKDIRVSREEAYALVEAELLGECDMAEVSICTMSVERVSIQRFAHDALMDESAGSSLLAAVVALKETP